MFRHECSSKKDVKEEERGGKKKFLVMTWTHW
jgi:hypothetical protein